MTKNGNLLWICAALASALGGLVMLVATGMAESSCKHGEILSDHGERIRAVEVGIEGVAEDVTEIKGDVKDINRKIDRALRGK